MKKVLLLVVVALAAAVYASSDRYAVGIGPWLIPVDRDRSEVNQKMRRFLDDLKFKDFDHAATFHTAEDREKKDIPTLIEKKFAVKPELLDIRAHDVLAVEIMPTGERAKVRTVVNVTLLNTGKTRDADAVFYWKKVDGVWYMDLQSSL